MSIHDVTPKLTATPIMMARMNPEQTVCQNRVTIASISFSVMSFSKRVKPSGWSPSLRRLGRSVPHVKPIVNGLTKD